MTGKGMSRRDFLRWSATAAAVGFVAPEMLAGQAREAARAVSEKIEGKAGKLDYRVLGRTGLKVTTMGVGCMITPEPIIAKALDLGINWFDTAYTYKGGRNEEEVGRVLKGKRDKGYICTKIPKKDTSQMLAMLDRSLSKLQTDYVDVVLIHGVSSARQVQNERFVQAMEAAKKQGKARFIGVSTHSNMTECINAVVNAKIYDVVLTKYNYELSPGGVKDKNIQDNDARQRALRAAEQLDEAIREAHKAKVGVIAMKTQHGNHPTPSGELTPHQAALRWVLKNENITCAIPGMRRFEELDLNYAAVTRPGGYADQRRLERYVAQIGAGYCASCGLCLDGCPHGVDIAEVRRCALYLDGYRDEALARTNYAELESNAAACMECAHCSAQCVRGADLQPILTDAHRRLA